jgi:hypothetical protein
MYTNEILVLLGGLLFIVLYGLIIYSYILQIRLNTALSNNAKTVLTLVMVFFPFLGFIAYYVIVKMRMYNWVNRLVRFR